jgi:hypothetical protein
MVNFQGCLFRSYPGKYQTLLDTGDGRAYRRIRKCSFAFLLLCFIGVGEFVFYWCDNHAISDGSLFSGLHSSLYYYTFYNLF